MNDSGELRKIQERYSSRTQTYEPLEAWVACTKSERERVIGRMLRRDFGTDVSNLRLLEIGCGHGDNLLYFLRSGFTPINIFGVDIIEDRVARARSVLPIDASVNIGNAAALKFPNESMDVVFQSLVFSSILDENLAHKVAREMWRVLKSGGTAIWYDFVYNNPANAGVRGVRRKQIRMYFPDADVNFHKVTLAPPISRRVCSISDRLYAVFNLFPFFRTHVVATLRKKQKGLIRE